MVFGSCPLNTLAFPDAVLGGCVGFKYLYFHPTEASCLDGKRIHFQLPSIHLEKNSWGSQHLGASNHKTAPETGNRKFSGSGVLVKEFWKISHSEDSNTVFGWWNPNFWNLTWLNDPKSIPRYPLAVWLDHRVMGISVSYIRLYFTPK